MLSEGAYVLPSADGKRTTAVFLSDGEMKVESANFAEDAAVLWLAATHPDWCVQDRVFRVDRAGRGTNRAGFAKDFIKTVFSLRTENAIKAWDGMYRAWDAAGDLLEPTFVSRSFSEPNVFRAAGGWARKPFGDELFFDFVIAVMTGSPHFTAWLSKPVRPGRIPDTEKWWTWNTNPDEVDGWRWTADDADDAISAIAGKRV